MTATLDQRPEIEAWLEAEREQLPGDRYLAHLVETAFPEVRLPEIKTGAELVAYWRAIGYVGMWADQEEMADSTEYINRQRQKQEDDIRVQLFGHDRAE